MGWPPVAWRPRQTMSRRIGVLAVAAATWAVADAQGPPPQFRAEARAVAVPVLVKSGGRPVADLTIDDFALSDSGVPQTITALQGVEAPLDVSLVIQQTLFIGGQRTGTFASEIDEIRRLLRPIDRLEVISTSDGGRVLLPIGSPDRFIQPASEPVRPCVTVYDAMVRVLVRPPVGGRHHLAILLVEGEGSGASVPSGVALAVAKRSQVAISVLVMPPLIGGTVNVTWGQRPLCAHARMAWNDPDRNTLRGISRISHPDDQQRAFVIEQRERLDRFAEFTGGSRLQPSVFSRSPIGAVRTVLNDARQRYTLHYSPTGVTAPGWHPISVSIRRSGRFDVSARPGYER